MPRSALTAASRSSFTAASANAPATLGSFSARSMAAVPSLCELVDPVRGESAAISATLSGTVSDELGSDVEGGNSLTSVVGEVVVELRSASRGATRVVAADSFRFFSVETLTLAKMLKFLIIDR